MAAARFDGVAEFPGAARFLDGWMGRGFAYPYSTPDQVPGFEALGVLGRGVVQTGRLVLASAALLEVRINAIRQLAEALTTGDLESGDGRTWEAITMLRLRLEGPVDLGRVCSVGYTIDYAYVGLGA
ncbi:MAG: hypothetical protein Tsb0013_16800 [Phycisphaerales bacterium]